MTRHDDKVEMDEYKDLFDPREYLRQYYSLPQLAIDDAELFRHFSGWLTTVDRRFKSVLDIGCGPTIHNTFAIAPFTDRIDLADYLTANLQEVRKWLDGDSDAHDWDALFCGVLHCQGFSSDCLDDRKTLYRNRVTNLLQCDLRNAKPFSIQDTYDLVTSFFCPECVAETKSEWFLIIERMLNMVSANGAIYFAAMRRAVQYRVLGNWLSAIPVDENDFQTVLREQGFTNIQTNVVDAPDWAEDGFQHIVLVSAHKA